MLVKRCCLLLMGAQGKKPLGKKRKRAKVLTARKTSKKSRKKIDYDNPFYVPTGLVPRVLARIETLLKADVATIDVLLKQVAAAKVETEVSKKELKQLEERLSLFLNADQLVAASSMGCPPVTYLLEYLEINRARLFSASEGVLTISEQVADPEKCPSVARIQPFKRLPGE